MTTTRRDILRHTPAAALAATGTAMALPAVADDLPSVPLTGDAKLFELIDRYRAEVERYRAIVAEADRPLYDLGYHCSSWSSNPLQDFEEPIYMYEPVESVTGAIALLGMIDEFARNEHELNRRRGDPSEGCYKVCEGPSVHVLPVLKALAERYMALIGSAAA